MKKHRTKIIAGVVIVAVLVGSFLWGAREGGSTGMTSSEGVGAAGYRGDVGGSPLGSETTDLPQNAQDTTGSSPEVSEAASDGDRALPENRNPDTADTENSAPAGSSETQTGENETQQQDNPDQTPDAADRSDESDWQQETQPPSNHPESDEQQTEDTDGVLTVTLIISCASILDNMDRLPAAKASLIPHDGIIFSGVVEFYEGESVFNILQRETRINRIHMEFMNSPIYNSAYIEGIHNIYEFDCGEGSGWMYSVNGYFPNYGSSRHSLQDGDVVMWQYTCDRGADIGGGSASDSYNFG